MGVTLTGVTETEPGCLPGGLFAQPWWLEAVAPGHWDAVTVEQGGEMFARLPYVMRRQQRRNHVVMPPLTPHLGPWLRCFPGKNPSRSSSEKRIMTELIERLPPFASFTQRFHPSITNWLPFYWRGFQQTTRYTYMLEDLTALPAIWNGMSPNLRRNVRNAAERLKVREDVGLDAFLDLNEKTFRRQGLAMPYSRELVARIDDACSQRGCRQILAAEDFEGRLHAGAYIVWDANAAYWLLSGGDPVLRNSGATSMLVWEAIQLAAKVTKVFDFEGSMLEPVERFFRAFGSTQRPYFQVSKTNSLAVRMSNDARSWVRMWRARRKSAG